jgi:hypothetical protein
MAPALCISIAIGVAAPALPQDVPAFYATTIRQVCESHGTNPDVFQYWWPSPKLIEEREPGQRSYSFGTTSLASFWEDRGRFYFRHSNPHYPREYERSGAWGQERCRELAQDLLVALRPGTLWRLVRSDLSEFRLEATYLFDAMIGDVPLRSPRLQPYAQVQIDAKSGALALMDIDAHSVQVHPGDLRENLSEVQYRVIAESVYASFRPYAQCAVEPEIDIVLDPERLVYLPHSFGERHLQMIAENRGLRVHIVRFVRTGQQPPRSWAWQWVMLDAKDGTPIAVIEDLGALREGDLEDAPKVEGAEVGSLKFRALGSNSQWAPLERSQGPIPYAAERAVLESEDGRLWSVSFDPVSRLIKFQVDQATYRASKGLARQVSASVALARKQPKMSASSVSN